MKKILFLMCCIPFFISLIGCESKKDTTKDENKVDQKDQAVIIEDQTIGDLSFESFNIVTDENNVTHIYFEVINNGATPSNISKVTFTLYNKKAEVLTLTKNVDSPIESGDFRTIETQVDVDLSNVDSVVYSVE